ncbi:hypothetical protein XENORESO_002429, partial [Xenotaenia resolanae]
NGSLMPNQEAPNVPLRKRVQRFCFTNTFTALSLFVFSYLLIIFALLVTTENIPKFQSSLNETTGLIKIFLPGSSGGGEDLLVCQELWDMAAANVVCKKHGSPLGAGSAYALSHKSLMANSDNKDLPRSCVSIRCQGFETSLAECEIYNKVKADDRMVAAATCYRIGPEGQCEQILKS